jgi:hypothetical protein
MTAAHASKGSGGMATILIVLSVYGLVAFIVVAVERALAAREEAAMLRRLAARRLPAPETIPLDRELASRESDTIRNLMNGTIDRAAYRAGMAAIAAQENREHPLGVPKSSR